MKQTAVEWLAKLVTEMGYVLTHVLEQVKEMEKQQIIDAFEKGYENGACVNDEESIYHGRNYYNKTFKQQ
jgi:hypothetical protein